MGEDRPGWYQVVIRKLRRQDRDVEVDKCQPSGSLRAASPTPTGCKRAGDCKGAMVARSQILVSGSTATLVGTMTNETGCDIHFTGRPPFASLHDADGTEPILLGDFNSPPRENPYSGDWVVHPGASVPYRSLPVTLQTPDSPWDGTGWSSSSQSTTLDTSTLGDERELRTIQLFS